MFAGVVGRGSGDRLPIRRLDLTESKVRELILELQPYFVLFQQLLALVPYVQQYDLIPSNKIATIEMPPVSKKLEQEKGTGPYKETANGPVPFIVFHNWD